MKIVKNINIIRNCIKTWKADGEKIGFVPTMGNLHEGHISLITSLKNAGATRIVTSIFVNPTQFAPNEDYKKYPRTKNSDQKKLCDNNVDLLFSPSEENMYPKNLLGELVIKYPEYSNILCGAHRPSHFNGVLWIVNKLLNIVNPDITIFGQKDYQQYILVENMIKDLHMPIKIICSPIIRESSGLAISSRNQYLSKKEKNIAPKLYEALRKASISIDNRLKIVDIEKNGINFLKKNGFEVDYFTIRNPRNLNQVDNNQSLDESKIILTAAKLGNTRLIDNILLL